MIQGNSIKAKGKSRETAAVKDALHRLVDELPDGKLHAAREYLEYLRDMGDPFLRALREAPVDDEPTTPADIEASDEAWEAYLLGETISAEEAKRELL